MKYYLPVISVSLLIYWVSAFNSSADNINATPEFYGNKINAFYSINLNGCPQKLLIQSENTDDNPILLYLHGGPGSSALIYSHLYSEELIREFIFVNWDQRGTAFSYYDGMDASKITEEQIRDDALVLTRYLLKTFHRKKLFLVGHSFGSVLGLQLVANHPELFYAYIGVGQVIDYDESVKITYSWLHKVLLENNDREGLDRIERDRFPYIDLVIKYGGHHRLSLDLDSLKKTSPFYFNGYLELANRGKKISQGNHACISSLMQKFIYRTIINKSIYDINVPLYFFEGDNDHVIACAPELVARYCIKTNVPEKHIIRFHNSAHYINVEEPHKFQNELLRIKKELKYD